jgi:integrase
MPKRIRKTKGIWKVHEGGEQSNRAVDRSCGGRAGGLHRKRIRSEDGYVFPARQTGEPLNVKRVGRQFRHVLKQAELGPFKLYDLRHSFASHLLDQGVKPVDVAEVMGHTHVTTTLMFYAHAVPKDLGYSDRLTAARQAVQRGKTT